MYVCMDGWMDGWMYGCMHACIYADLHVSMYERKHNKTYAPTSFSTASIKRFASGFFTSLKFPRNGSLRLTTTEVDTFSTARSCMQTLNQVKNRNAVPRIAYEESR